MKFLTFPFVLLKQRFLLWSCRLEHQPSHIPYFSTPTRIILFLGLRLDLQPCEAPEYDIPLSRLDYSKSSRSFLCCSRLYCCETIFNKNLKVSSFFANSIRKFFRRQRKFFESKRSHIQATPG